MKYRPTPVGELNSEHPEPPVGWCSVLRLRRCGRRINFRGTPSLALLTPGSPVLKFGVPSLAESQAHSSLERELANTGAPCSVTAPSRRREGRARPHRLLAHRVFLCVRRTRCPATSSPRTMDDACMGVPWWMERETKAAGRRWFPSGVAFWGAGARLEEQAPERSARASPLANSASRQGGSQCRSEHPTRMSRCGPYL
jgi:hypothetical protein